MKQAIAAALSSLTMLCAAPAFASGPTADQDRAAERRVYIDPETGERRQPTAEERAELREQAKANRKAGDKSKQVIEGPDGSKAIIHDTRDWAEHRTERSVDESGNAAE